jgi:hypothetical protein
MHANTSNLAVGAFAGIAAGVMVFAALNAGVFAFALLFAAPLAIYIATMGWGRYGGFASVATGLAVTGYFGSPATALIGGVLLFIPACLVGIMANLGQRSAPGKAIVWYPLSSILLRLMMLLFGGFVVFGALTGYSNELVIPTFVDLMREIAAANPDMPQGSEAAILAQATTYANLIPVIVPGLWLMLHVAVAFLAARITRRSGLMARGDEDIAASVRLPMEAILLLVAGLAGTFMLPGVHGLAAKVAFGIAICGFGLIGLAQLHYSTRGASWRGAVLALAYGSIILLTFPLVFFAASGVMRSLANHPKGPSGPNHKSGPSGPGSSHTNKTEEE